MIEIKEEMAPSEKALLAGLEFPQSDRWEVHDSLAELSQLAATAGVRVMGESISRRSKPTAATYIGRGKAEEIAARCQEEDIDVVIFDEDLTPAQLRNLQDMIGVKVLDRTELILDIFARRARTREAQLQIELAQLKYLLPRLVGKGVILSRLGGGIGTRGPGETKLEVDRRRIRERIHQLGKELRGVRRHRELQRKQRKETGLPIISIIGYTNSGKSTLLNALTGAGVFVEDKLFATLDPTTRKAVLPSGREVLFSDTVGFIRKLPHHLVDSFRATLEEVNEADILLEVLDLSQRMIWERKRAVEEVLRELKVESKPLLVALNKIDLVKDRFLLNETRARLEEGVPISALKKRGLESLLQVIDERLASTRRYRRLVIPQSRAELIAWLHKKGQVVKTDYHQNNVYVEVMIEDRWLKNFQEYII